MEKVVKVLSSRCEIENKGSETETETDFSKLKTRNKFIEKCLFFILRDKNCERNVERIKNAGETGTKKKKGSVKIWNILRK